MYRIVSLLIALIIHQSVFTQNVGIGTEQPHQSALLDLQSSGKGLLIPRVSTTQRNNIPSPAAGLLVFDTDKRTIYMFDGTQWLPLGYSASAPFGISVTAGDLLPDAHFGYSVGLSGGYAVISALANEQNAVGSVYIFLKSAGTWTFQAKILPSDGAAARGFGKSVAISGDYILVGAPHRNSNRGAVYVFNRNGTSWSQTQILTPATEEVNSFFGMVMSFKGVHALIGAPEWGNQQNWPTGTVYAFNRNINGWMQTQQLFGITTLLSFGASIDLSGPYAIIGAPLGSVQEANKGAAYLFQRTGLTWTPIDTLRSPLNSVFQFGRTVALSETDGLWVFVTEPNKLSSQGEEGVVHVYRQGASGLDWVSTITPPVSAQYGIDKDFGGSLSIYGDHLLIGSTEVPNVDAVRGRVYVYKYDNTAANIADRWQFSKVLKDNSSLSANDSWNGIGSAIFINGFDIIIGNRGSNDGRGKVLFVNVE